MKALVLAGGFPQIALLEELKSRKIETVLADWHENAVARSHADVFYQTSTLDVEAITKIAKDEHVDFVITACTDQALLTMATVSETLGLPSYLDRQTALNVTNKAYMKEMFEKHRIPTAQHATLQEYDAAALSNMQYPLIVKPVDCNSSKGVKKVMDINELQDAFADALQMSRSKTVIVEEFIEGQEISADIYVENGDAHVLCVSNSDKIASRDSFVIFRGCYSKKNDERIREAVREVAQKIADAFGLKDSPMLVQMIVDGERVSVVEFSARTGGGVKYVMIKMASGFDVIEAVVDLALGKKPHVGPAIRRKNYIANEFIYCKPGVFDRLDGFEELKTGGTLTDYYLFKWRGSRMDCITNSGDRIAGFTIQGDTEEEIQEKHSRAVSALRVLDTNGQDIMRHDLLPDLCWQ